MPTWWIGLPKNTRSPGCRSDCATRWVTAYCCWLECGSETPPRAQAHMVSPEQSKVDGPAAAHSYGLPICAYASATAAPARPLAGPSYVGVSSLDRLREARASAAARLA